MNSPRLVKTLAETLVLAARYMDGTPCTSLIAETTEGFFRINADGTYHQVSLAEAEWIEANA